MKIISLLLLLTSSTLMAAEQFRIEDHFKNPAKIPAPVTAYLTKELGAVKMAACKEIKPNELFEAEIVSLNKSAKAYVVKPADMCLCTDHHCPVWMFSTKGKPTKPIWSHSATQTLEILDKKLNGYQKLKETSAEATRGHESIWSWDRNNYMEIDKTVWTFDTEKNCRFTEETSQLMDGRMVNHSIKCFQDPPK